MYSLLSLILLILPSTPNLQVYFEEDTLSKKLAYFISNAQYSLDICFHQFYDSVVVESTLSAWNRGVKVRVITEHDYITYNGTQELQNAGIPVMGHLGLTPQAIYKFGTYTVRAKEKHEAEKLLADAEILEKLGCFGIVLEKIPALLTKEVSEKIAIPTIGIGGGKYADGQVLVIHDLLGMTHEFNPRFLRRYMNLYEDMGNAISRYVSDVKSQDFPSDDEQY